MFRLLKKKFEEIKKRIKGKVEKKEKVKKKKGLIKKVKEKIEKKVRFKILKEEDIEKLLDRFEISLIEADCSFEVAEKFKENLKKELVGKEIKRREEEKVVKNSIKRTVEEILELPRIDLIKIIEEKSSRGEPALFLFLGFNGSGKTTSIAKLANFLLKKNISVVLAAADTFRAASIEQLEEHAKKLGVKVIKHKYGADPAAVIFDSIKYAKPKGIKVVLADTAGRTHVNKNLIEELRKIVRVNKPDLKILVLDSLTGSDVLEQTRMFNEAVGVDAIVFTKVDVNEKGGNILSVAYEFKKPILFLGIGQKYEDIKFFEKEWLVKQIVG
ncbi:MAG: signal recognition particle-docking protein FtsY [Candidatus Aenigmarchaeota archaeon]|nr:signal recognition particle-docking protein FtsY [Candidatus Aenigmarchaeota archaeon]